MGAKYLLNLVEKPSGILIFTFWGHFHFQKINIKKSI